MYMTLEDPIIFFGPGMNGNCVLLEFPPPKTSKATKASNAAKGSNEGNIFRTKFLQKKLRRTKYPALCFVKSVRQV